MEKKILIMTAVFLIPLILADMNFEISVIPHYYNQGYEFIRYSESMDYDGISFEIIGINNFSTSRILNLTLFKATPKIFKDSLIQKKDSLRIMQTADIFETGIIEKKNLNDSQFFIAVIGTNEDTKEACYGEKYLNISLVQNNTENIVLSGVGNLIWEGESVKGLWIGIFIVGIMVFISWKYNLVGYIGGITDNYRKKERYKRIYGKSIY